MRCILTLLFFGYISLDIFATQKCQNILIANYADSLARCEKYSLDSMVTDYGVLGISGESSNISLLAGCMKSGGIVLVHFIPVRLLGVTRKLFKQTQNLKIISITTSGDFATFLLEASNGETEEESEEGN